MFAYSQSFGNASHLHHRSHSGMRGNARRIAAENRDSARGWARKAEQQLDCSGLAGAVRSEQSHEFTSTNVERKVYECLRVSVALAHRFQSCDGLRNGNLPTLNWQNL